MRTRNLLAASLVAFATLFAHAQDTSTPRAQTPMPQSTTQPPAPVVRRAQRPNAAPESNANPDGTLQHGVHAGEYQDSYPVPHTAKTKSAATQVPTSNPLTSLSTASAPASAKVPASPKPSQAAQPAKPKITATADTRPKVPSAITTKPAPPKGDAKTAQVAAQLPPGPFNRAVIVIDPSHGGTDSGSHITDSVLEKDVDLQLAFKLRSLLTARGFTVVLTRDSDSATLPDKPDAALTLDVRAGLANRQQAVACLLLHATASGHGVHLYTSELNAVPAEPYAAPWLTAQNGWVAQSLLLEKQIGHALTRANVPLVLSRASVRPVDSLTCPALVVELAPDGKNSSSISDDGYQQRVASAIATALIFWQNAAQPPARLAPPLYKAPTPVKPAIDTTAVPAPAPSVVVQP